jgi:hypothetical protein
MDYGLSAFGELEFSKYQSSKDLFLDRFEEYIASF